MKLPDKAVMKKTNYPVTPAVRLLREKKIVFEPHLYPYEEHGGTRHAAEALHINEHIIIKMLVYPAPMERDEKRSESARVANY